MDKIELQMNEFLKEARIKAGLTQNDVSSKLGYKTPQYVSNWERGSAKPPKERITELSKILKIRKETLIKIYTAHIIKTLG